MASSELSVMLTAKGNLETELRGARDRVKDLSAEIRKIQTSGGSVGEDLADEFRQATVAADKLSRQLSDVNRKVKDTASASTSAAAKVSKAWTKAANVFSNDLVAGLSGAALLAFGKRAVDTFAQVQDAQSALTATFGANGEALARWAAASGDALNLSQQEALAAAQTFAIFGDTAGLTGQQLQTFTTDLTTRAADLASYFGGSTADAIGALGSALRGEAEPARRYGILLDDATLKAAALAEGIYDGTGNLSQQQKVLAAYRVVLDQSSRAQGDVARTSESMANQIKDSQQQMADFQATAGETVAIALNPLLKVANGAARTFSGLPGPLQQVSIAVGMIGTAALIATPRIVALNGALASRGGLVGVGKSARGAAAGMVALTAAYIALDAARGDASYNWTPWEGTFEGMAGLNNAVAGLTKGTLDTEFGFLANVADSMGIIQKQSSSATQAVGKFDSELATLVAQGKQDDAQRLFDELVGGAKEWGGSVDDVKKLLPGYSAAMDAAAAVTGDTADALGDVGDEAAGAAAALAPLTRAMNRFGRAVDRRNALRGWRQSLKDFLEKPSADAALTASQAFQATVETYKDGSKAQAEFVAGNYDEMKRTINRSGLSDAAKTQLLGPLNDAKAAADQVLAGLNAIDGKTVTTTVIVNKLGSPGMDPSRFATGGPVWGPGTATSDSIPALLSNGEFVMRAAAVRTIGMDTLTRLNRGVDDPMLLERLNGAPVQAGPYVGQVHVEVHNPARDVDVEKAVLRGMSRAERIKRERG